MSNDDFVVEMDVPEQPVELKLPCTATDCDAIPMSIRTRKTVTIYEIKVGSKYRYGTNSWGQPLVRKETMSGVAAFNLLTHIKAEMEPKGTLESVEQVQF